MSEASISFDQQEAEASTRLDSIVTNGKSILVEWAVPKQETKITFVKRGIVREKQLLNIVVGGPIDSEKSAICEKLYYIPFGEIFFVYVSF
jgi:hypothetical protein